MFIYEYLNVYTMVYDGMLTYTMVYDGMQPTDAMAYNGMQSTVVFLQRDILATWHFYNESVKRKNTIDSFILL